MTRFSGGGPNAQASARAHAILLALFALLLFFFSHARGFSVAPLADDVGVIRVAAQQALDFAVFGPALEKWHTPLVPGSTMWRPLPVLSFALDALSHGDQVSLWRLTNVALHLLCAILVGGVVRAFGFSLSAAAIAFGAFALLPWAPEVSIWIVGRYDGFATLLVLLALFCALSSSGRDARSLASLAAAALAYASKESAATAIALIASVLWLRDCHANTAWLTRPSAATIRLTVAHGVLLIAYLVWRQWLFQSTSLDLYATGSSSRGVGAIVSSWLAHGLSARDYLSIAPVASTVASVMCVLLLLWALSRRAQRFGVSAGLIFAAIVAAALAVVFPSPNIGSDGARIYHLMAVGFAIAIGAAAAAQSARLQFAFAIGVLLALAFWQRAAVEEWRIASNEMHRLQNEIPRLGNSLLAKDYALVVAPDRIGRVPFARNANGALLLAYSGDRERVSQMIISTDLGAWEWWKLSADGVVRKHLTKREDAPAAPTQFFCFNGSSLQALGFWQSATQADWNERWRDALHRACPNLNYGR
ncbi:MAG: hypothetical protein EAZ24_06110 [Burkholderiales bacterium]|nr:MAG: hypothetical protein EAZ24_06110 [Burkholderiales bacterium]TAG80003.1 MAG: hypothetical protein EAZ21_09200 [Betaproteobacteria bacterium]